MPNYGVLLMATALLGGGAYVAWISLQSLRQGRALCRPVEVGHAEAHEGRTVALYGRIQVTKPVEDPGWKCLWYRYQLQAESGRRNRHWRTLKQETQVAAFHFFEGDLKIHFAGAPTETQGLRTAAEYADVGLLERLGGARGQRIVHTWLPALPRITVLGRLKRRGDALFLDRDPKVGLILSVLDPARTAVRETRKGRWGLVLALFLLVAGGWFAYATLFLGIEM